VNQDLYEAGLVTRRRVLGDAPAAGDPKRVSLETMTVVVSL
jgi:hypothetical protein